MPSPAMLFGRSCAAGVAAADDEAVVAVVPDKAGEWRLDGRRVAGEGACSSAGVALAEEKAEKRDVGGCRAGSSRARWRLGLREERLPSTSGRRDDDEGAGDFDALESCCCCPSDLEPGVGGERPDMEGKDDSDSSKRAGSSASSPKSGEWSEESKPGREGKEASLSPPLRRCCCWGEDTDGLALSEMLRRAVLALALAETLLLLLAPTVLGPLVLLTLF